MKLLTFDDMLLLSQEYMLDEYLTFNFSLLPSKILSDPRQKPVGNKLNSLFLPIPRIVLIVWENYSVSFPSK